MLVCAGNDIFLNYWLEAVAAQAFNCQTVCVAERQQFAVSVVQEGCFIV
jgi:hypothetical protein